MNESHINYIEKFKQLDKFDKESAILEHIKELTNYLTKENQLSDFNIECEDFNDEILIHLLYIKELNANLIKNLKV